MGKHALCTGINDYPGTDSDLAGCVNDARDRDTALGKRGFKVAMLLDHEASLAAMTESMAALIRNAGKGDTVGITYSGHGSWVPDSSGDEPDGRHEGLCPHDIERVGPLLDDEIRRLLSLRAAGLVGTSRKADGRSHPRRQRPLAGRLPAYGIELGHTLPRPPQRGLHLLCPEGPA